MVRKGGLPAYLTALIPGIGYMYLGLKRKGIEAFLLFILIEPVFDVLGLGFLTALAKWPLWFYTFFDTINLAARIDKGEFIPDSDFLFLGRFLQNDGLVNGGSNKLWYLAGWGLIVLGSLSIINRILREFDFYQSIRNVMSIYLIPVVFVLAGVYLLLKNNRDK